MPKNCSETVDAVSLADLQRTIMDLQRQVGRCTDVAKELYHFRRLLTTSSLPDRIKLPLFHGYESENFDRWLEKFLLHLERRRLRSTSDAALAELALHLAGPAESFFGSLSRSDKEAVDSLSTALRDRFSFKDRVWRMRQMLSARKQGSNEPQDKYIEDLQNKFDNLELSEEEQVWFFTQGLRPDTQGEVLMRQPRTFQEAENVARLTQIVQQSIQDANGTDALSRIQQQLYALVFGMATKEKSKEAFVSAYQFSPTPSADDKLARLERDLNDINQVMTRINGHHVQDSAVAAYLPSSRDPYGRDSGNEISRLREENRQLKAALREPHSQTKRNVEPSDVTRLPQDLSTALSDIKRMQSRIDGFKRTYASKTTKPEQQRGRTLNGRPVCDICGRVGHVRQNCFSRTDQRNQSSGP